MALLVKLHRRLHSSNDHQRLIVGAVAQEHGHIESKTNPVLAAWAAEQILRQSRIFLARHLLIADRAGRNVSELAVRANGRKHRSSDISTVLASLPNRIRCLLDFEGVEIPVLFQEAVDLRELRGGQLKIGPALDIAMNPLQRMFRVEFHWSVSPEFSSKVGRRSEFAGAFSGWPERDPDTHACLLISLEGEGTGFLRFSA
jgi:hypothetical protein